MKPNFRAKSFIYPIIATFLTCILIMRYVIIVGEPWTHILMDDPLFFLEVGQISIAIIIGISLALLEVTRKNGLWFIIPAILIIFAILYHPILHFVYPCC